MNAICLGEDSCALTLTPDPSELGFAKVAAVALVALELLATVNVASSLTVPVSSCATGALFTETLIVSVGCCRVPSVGISKHHLDVASELAA